MRTRLMSSKSGSKINGTYVVSLGKERESSTAFLINEKQENVFEIRTKAGAECRTLLVNWKVDHAVVRVFENGQESIFQFWGSDEVTYGMQYFGTTFDVNVYSPQQASLMPFIPEVKTTVNAKQLLSPMPGVIVHLNVKVGQSIAAGAEILTLEAMKMRNKLRAEFDGKVKSIKAVVGKTVEDEEILVEFE